MQSGEWKINYFWTWLAACPAQQVSQPLVQSNSLNFPLKKLKKKLQLIYRLTLKPWGLLQFYFGFLCYKMFIYFVSFFCAFWVHFSQLKRNKLKLKKPSSSQVDGVFLYISLDVVIDYRVYIIISFRLYIT